MPERRRYCLAPDAARLRPAAFPRGPQRGPRAVALADCGQRACKVRACYPSSGLRQAAGRPRKTAGPTTSAEVASARMVPSTSTRVMSKFDRPDTSTGTVRFSFAKSRRATAQTPGPIARPSVTETLRGNPRNRIKVLPGKIAKGPSWMGSATWDAGWAKIAGATLMKGVPSARAAPFDVHRPRTTAAATRAQITTFNARLNVACSMSVQPYAMPLLTGSIG